jgi:hypothetical protein
LINKVGAKAGMTNTNTLVVAPVTIYEELEDADCEACKL